MKPQWDGVDGADRKEVLGALCQTLGSGLVPHAGTPRLQLLQGSSQVRNAVQALQGAVHVARVAQILQTCEVVPKSWFMENCMPFPLRGSPRQSKQGAKLQGRFF